MYDNRNQITPIMATFKYAPMFQLGEDTTQYYKIPGSEHKVL